MSENRYRVFRERPGEWIIENTRTKTQYSHPRWSSALNAANVIARTLTGFQRAIHRG